MNSHAYRYELIENKKGMFDNYVDMAYILTMEESSRRDHYMNQIEKYIPHKTITIQYNKGFKKSNKKLYKQDSVHDLNDAYYHVFLNALKNNYKNIIVFEDNFIFDNTINQYIVDNIGQFIKNNPYHLYHLGPSFHISMPNITSLSHLKSYILFSSHAVIYNRDYIYHYIKKYEIGFKLQTDHIWSGLNILKYAYYKPLCFQIYEDTENRDNWICSNIAIKIINLLKLDKQYKPGFTILNIISYIVSFHLIYIFLTFYL
jgi:hypothetical protein